MRTYIFYFLNKTSGLYAGMGMGGVERSEKDEEANYYMAATFDDLIWGDKTEAAGPKYWSLFYRYLWSRSLELRGL